MENLLDNVVQEIIEYITYSINKHPDVSDRYWYRWTNTISELNITFHAGINKNYFHYCIYQFYNNNILEGDYFFGDHLNDTDNKSISDLISPFKDCSRALLNITSFFKESSAFKNRYYIIQSFYNNQWHDVLFSRGNICTANKKARHYRNQNKCDTRVVEIEETVSYFYKYNVVKGYNT